MDEHSSCKAFYERLYDGDFVDSDGLPILFCLGNETDMWDVVEWIRERGYAVEFNFYPKVWRDRHPSDSNQNVILLGGIRCAIRDHSHIYAGLGKSMAEAFVEASTMFLRKAVDNDGRT